MNTFQDMNELTTFLSGEGKIKGGENLYHKCMFWFTPTLRVGEGFALVMWFYGIVIGLVLGFSIAL